MPLRRIGPVPPGCTQ